MFQPNLPQPLDPLDVSQQDLLDNNLALDSVFGVDHYKFSNGTTDAGKHNTIRTPNVHVPPGHPATAAAEPAMYGMQDSVNIGVIQYSRGPSNAVPSPITIFQSPSPIPPLAPAAIYNILDLTGLPVFMGMVYASGTTGALLVNAVSFVSFTGGIITLSPIVTSSPTNRIFISNTGNIIQLVAGTGGLATSYTSVQILRTM